jgi:LPS-assembly protein
LCLGAAAHAQDLTPPTLVPPLVSTLVSPPPPPETPTSSDDLVQFSADAMEYDTNQEVVTATGDVRMFRSGDRLRADKVVWNRKTGKIVATGNIAVTNPRGDISYSDSMELTDSLKDGVADNMLVVLEKGGRLAARRGTRELDETIELEHASYTPCAVTSTSGCPKEPSWKITAVQVIYRPSKNRLYYTGARLSVFGLPALPLPDFSNPLGGENASGLLSPDLRYDRVNGLGYAQPYFFALAPNEGLTITPRLFTNALPLLKVDYSKLTSNGAFEITGYLTRSRPSDDQISITPVSNRQQWRGYIDSVFNFQLDPNWSISGSLRLTTDSTFLRRYDISSDDRLRSTVSVERIDQDSYFGVTGWYVQTYRIGDVQGQQPFVIPEIDYRRRMDEGLLGGTIEFQANSLGLARTEGEDDQSAFASVEWNLRKLTPWGQEVTFTALARGDVYHASDVLATTVPSYQGQPGFTSRFISAFAIDVKYPLIGDFLGGTQRLTPRVQLVGSPPTDNNAVPNEDSRAVDLSDTDLFALSRYPGYDRWEDSSRVTYGVEWAVDLPGFSFSTNIGQSYRFSNQPLLFPEGSGLSEQVSDIVGRTEVRFRDFVSITGRYRLDKDNLLVRENEIDATIGSRKTYILLGYLKLNRDINPTIEDLQNSEEVRVAGRIQFSRFWSLYGSTVIDLTTLAEDPLSYTNGFSPVRHRVGITYEDDCLKIGATWSRYYQNTGDARAGDSFLVSISFKNLGR